MTENRKHPICFFTTADMYNKVQRIAKYREVSLSHLLRELIRDFLKSRDCQEFVDGPNSLEGCKDVSNTSPDSQEFILKETK
jgi:molybdopterin-guanine dinucleotide biosynthesis protein A